MMVVHTELNTLVRIAFYVVGADSKKMYIL